MEELFFTLSGEHETLPLAEMRAIFEAEGIDYSLTEKLDQLVRVKVNTSSLPTLVDRAAFTRICALELFVCRAQKEDIKKALRKARIKSLLKPGESFVVRVKHVRQYSRRMNGMVLEAKIGQEILNIIPESRVNLKKPQKRFIGVLTSGRFIFGLKLAEIMAKPFVERRPRGKPFFHPSAMQAKLARCMVNLARPKRGQLVFDPFCGTGTMLVEALMMGCRAVGLDIQRRMVRGTSKNLRHFKLEPEGVIVADVHTIPLSKADCVVTDPPYGISSTTMKRTTEGLIIDLLKSASHLLSSGRYICLASPKTLKITEKIASMGYRCLESYHVYVHRSLTREVIVLEKA